MSILKSFICAVSFLAHAVGAELYVNCMAAEHSDPLGVGCGTVNSDVLDMLGSCSTLVRSQNGMRGMRSREQRGQIPPEQSERRLNCDYCYQSGNSPGEIMACCMMPACLGSYCGSPTTARRRLMTDTEDKIAEDIGISETPLEAAARRHLIDEDGMALITENCTAAFKSLGEEYESPAKNMSHCLGSSEKVYCESIQVFVGAAHAHHNVTGPGQ